MNSNNQTATNANSPAPYISITSQIKAKITCCVSNSEQTLHNNSSKEDKLNQNAPQISQELVGSTSNVSEDLNPILSPIDE